MNDRICAGNGLWCAGQLIIVMWFSRKREYSADAGAAEIKERANKMVAAALERLRNNHESQLEGSMMAFPVLPASQPRRSCF